MESDRVTADRWRQVEKIFYDALEVDPRDRISFLDRACADDPSLRNDVEALIASHSEAGSFLKPPSVFRASIVGQTFGPYEVRALLGSGGMGEVYRARDSKLKRDVAIKILPDKFSSDPQRISRFQREAEVLASLNHPHIGAIYDLAHFGESQFLILELVEGETLADRLSRGPIPLHEALPMAQQIAGALEAAHEKGIVHRDLKPANIKIRPDGTVKVLDFGLAKVREGTGPDPTNSPTIVSISESGMLLGTAAYMSPEQAKGKDADRTSDVWAFGCVLFEMLTGRRAFEGETTGEILAAVLKEEPDLNRVRETPQSIRRLLRRCLQKDSRIRLHDMADVRLEIEEGLSGSVPDGGALVQGSPRSKERVLTLSALAFVSVLAILFSFRPSPSPPERRVEITTPPTRDPVGIAISPDGTKIAFIATSQGRPKLWVRSLDSVSARPLPGTDGALGPFWSPDSRSLGFFADGKLKRIDIENGLVQALADSDSAGGSWNQDGVIIFSKIPDGPLFRVASSPGGEATPVTRINPPRDTRHRYPQFLPDGRHFLYHSYGTAPGTYVGQLDSSETKKLDITGAGAVYAASGYLLFIHQEALLAQKFDPVKLEVTGDAFLIAESLAEDLSTVVAVSASAAGPIAYRPRTGRRQFIRFDRSGREIGRVGDPDDVRSANPSPSPGGRRIALQRVFRGQLGIWLLETERGVLSPFLSEGKTGLFPVWSRDGRRIAFSTSRGAGVLDLYWKTVDEAGDEEPLLTTPQGKVALDWSPDGRFLLYISNPDPTIGLPQTMWALPINGDRTKPIKITERAGGGKFSPDGKWVSYGSGPEIYVQSFPDGKYRQPLTVGGGGQGRWGADGKEFFYIARDGWLMAVPIRPGSDGKPIELGKPERLFPTQIGSSFGTSWNTGQYIVSDDGQRFLMNAVVEEPGSSPIEIIFNWRPERGR
jgi:serine/threonine protein kinase/Tol biopolymer transport system component